MNKVALSFVDNTGLFRAVAGVRGASARSEVYTIIFPFLGLILTKLTYLGG
jgi:hypothetical protein